jgi:hypothetical protein
VCDEQPSWTEPQWMHTAMHKWTVNAHQSNATTSTLFALKTSLLHRVVLSVIKVVRIRWLKNGLRLTFPFCLLSICICLATFLSC